MRLAYIVGTYPERSETFIAREIDGLKARGHNIGIFSLTPPESGPAPGVAYGWTTPLQRAFRKIGGTAVTRMLARRWRSQLTAGGYQAVVAHFASLPSTVALDLVGDLPLFISAHARDIYVEAEHLSEKLQRATALVTCTKANEKYLRQRCPSEAGKIHLIYHGLPQLWLDAYSPRRKREPDEPLHLLAVGRFVEKKGFNILLDACAQLQKEGISFRLALVGDGPLRPQLLAQREELGLQDHIEMAGWLDLATMRTAYAWADVFCCPSILAHDGDRDGLPNVVLEAMSTGLPVIASNLSGIPEAVIDGDNGLLIPPGDIEALTMAIVSCADSEVRHTLGSCAALHVCRHFSEDVWLERLETIFAQGILQFA